MKKRLPLAVLLIGLSIPLFGGCIAAIGNNPDAPRSNATLGQQLIDLQKARDSGVISEAEFQTQRAKFLGQPTHH